MQASFPHLAHWQAVQFWLVGQSLDPQQSISGDETIVPTFRARWMATANFVLDEEENILQWQAFLAQMQGRLGTALVPARSRHRPKDRNGHHLPFCDIAGIAGAQTWEHFGLENTDIVRIRTAAAAPLRATRMDLDLVNSTGVRPGQFFSIGERLHRVQLHWQPNGATHRIQFEPPLRQAVAAGTRLEIERPVCKMRMITETEGLFDQSLEVMPRVQVNFSEAL